VVEAAMKVDGEGGCALAASEDDAEAVVAVAVADGVDVVADWCRFPDSRSVKNVESRSLNSLSIKPIIVSLADSFVT
jgi:hypothetical protein